MDIGGFFRNWGNWSQDPSRNDALNQAVTLFGANMLAGAGSGRNFSSILGRAIGAGVEGFNEREQSIRRNKLTDSQIEENRSQQEWRRAQIEEARRKAALAERAMKLRASVFGGDPQGFQTALDTQATVPGPQGPTVRAQQLGERLSAGRIPSWQDLSMLAAGGALDATDISLVDKATTPQNVPGGSWSRDPRTGQMTWNAKLPDGATMTPGGRVAPLAGAPGAQNTMEYATASARARADVEKAGPIADATNASEARWAFPKAAGTAAGQAAFSPGMVPSYNPTTGAMEGTPVFQFGMGQLGGQLPGAAAPGPAPRGGPTPGAAPGRAPGMVPGAIPQGPGRDDKQRDANTLAADASWRKSADEAVEAGGTAKLQLAQLRAMRALNNQTGWGQSTIGAAANVLVTLGIAKEAATKIASDKQMFQSYVQRFVSEVQNAQKGIATDKDALRYEAMMPSIANTPQANEFLFDYMESLATATAMRADYYRLANEKVARREWTPADVEAGWRAVQVPVWELPTMARWRQLEAQRRQAGDGGIPR